MTGPEIVVYIGALVGLMGGGVALFNSWKGVLWKRAEYGSAFIKDLSQNSELVMFCRALEWNGGLLVIPENLRPLLNKEKKVIRHSPEIFQKAVARDVFIDEMEIDERLQVYRTAADNFFSWLTVVDNALRRKIFYVEDVEDIGYWVRLVCNVGYLDDFMDEYNYTAQIHRLRRCFSKENQSFLPHPGQATTIHRGGLGALSDSRSADG